MLASVNVYRTLVIPTENVSVTSNPPFPKLSVNIDPVGTSSSESSDEYSTDIDDTRQLSTVNGCIQVNSAAQTPRSFSISTLAIS